MLLRACGYRTRGIIELRESSPRRAAWTLGPDTIPYNWNQDSHQADLTKFNPSLGDGLKFVRPAWFVGNPAENHKE